MNISKSEYIEKSRNSSEELVRNIAKLYIYKSPEDVPNWLNSISEIFKETESRTCEWKCKSLIDKLYCILDPDYGTISLIKLSEFVDKIIWDKSLVNLPRNNNYNVYRLGEILHDLILKFKYTKVLSSEEVDEIIYNWYETEIKWY